MKRVTLLCAILIVALFAVGCNDQKAPTGLSESTPVVPASLAKANASHKQFDFPVDYEDFNPYTGEAIHFTGAVHGETHLVFDGSGGVHGQFTANDHNLGGLGLSSGTKYRRVGQRWTILTSMVFYHSRRLSRTLSTLSVKGRETTLSCKKSFTSRSMPTAL